MRICLLFSECRVRHLATCPGLRFVAFGCSSCHYCAVVNREIIFGNVNEFDLRFTVKRQSALSTSDLFVEMMPCCCFGIRKSLEEHRVQDIGVYIGSGVSYDFYEFETCEEINLSSSRKGVFSIVFAIHDALPHIVLGCAPHLPLPPSQLTLHPSTAEG
jgi:hypothetical protein